MNLLEELDAFSNVKGKEFHFVEFQKPNKILCWKHLKKEMGEDGIRLMALDVKSIKSDTLKELGVWDKLTNETQISVDEHIEKIIEEMPKRGRKPRADFKGLPENMVCKCGREVKANYYYLSKKAEDKGTTLKELIESYQCQICNPTKGRKKKKKGRKKKKKGNK